MSFAFTEKRFRSVYEYVPQLGKPLSKRLKCFSFGLSKQTIFNVLPILSWLPKYSIKKWLLADIITGITVGIMQIPQGMAYSSLAGLPPVYGLYTGFFPVLLYTILGTSRHVSIGAYGMASLMLGASLEAIVPSPVVDEAHVTENITQLWNAVNEERILYANAVTLFSGLFLSKVKTLKDLLNSISAFLFDMLFTVLILFVFCTGSRASFGCDQILFSIFHLGFVTRLFARSVQSGFIFGIAFLTVLSQVKSLLGVRTGSYSGAFSSIRVIRDIILAIASLNQEGRWHTAASVVTSTICIVFLWVVKIINERYRKKFPFSIPIPGEMLVIVFGTLISWCADLENVYHVLVVGTVPRGLPEPRLPRISLFGTIAVDSFVVAIIGYSVSVSLAQAFAADKGYKINPNQELLAFGTCNFFGSFFSCIPSFPTMSRSCVQLESGGKTQLVGWVSSLLMLFVLLYIAPVFQYLPKACLASIVVVAVSGMFKNISNVKRYWTNHKLDAVTWSVTCAATILLDVILGLACGIIALLLFSLFKASFVKLRHLERVDTTDVYRDKGLYKKSAPVNDHVMLVKFHGPLNFFNTATFRKSIIKESGIDPADKAKEMKTSTSIKDEDIELEVKSPSSVSKELIKVVDSPVPSIDVILLDCSGISSLDIVGTDTFAKVIADYKEVGIDFLLASCSENVIKCLETASDYDVTGFSYVTVHDAVEAVTSGNYKVTSCCEEETVDHMETPT